MLDFDSLENSELTEEDLADIEAAQAREKAWRERDAAQMAERGWCDSDALNGLDVRLVPALGDALLEASTKLPAEAVSHGLALVLSTPELETEFNVDGPDWYHIFKQAETARHLAAQVALEWCAEHYAVVATFADDHGPLVKHIGDALVFLAEETKSYHPDFTPETWSEALHRAGEGLRGEDEAAGAEALHWVAQFHNHLWS